MSIERRDVEHAARLSRLELGEEEIETFTEQLAKIVGYVDKLRELDVTNEEPMMHAAEGASFRDDVPHGNEPGGKLERKKALRGAPSAGDGFFRVPPVIDPGH